MKNIVNPSLVDFWKCSFPPSRLSGEQRQAGLAELCQLYSQPTRHYHNLEHVQAVLEKIRELIEGKPVSHPLLLAAWFHDAIYDSRQKDNEEQSARLARERLQQWDIAPADIEETERLILLTKTHQAAADDQDGQVLLDADLAILGSDAAAYDRYCEAIRREYAWVAEEDYRQGRGRALESFLSRSWIYFTAAMRESHEARARANIQRELEKLGRGTT